MQQSPTSLLSEQRKYHINVPHIKSPQNINSDSSSFQFGKQKEPLGTNVVWGLNSGNIITDLVRCYQKPHIKYCKKVFDGIANGHAIYAGIDKISSVAKAISTCDTLTQQELTSLAKEVGSFVLYTGIFYLPQFYPPAAVPYNIIMSAYTGWVFVTNTESLYQENYGKNQHYDLLESYQLWSIRHKQLATLTGLDHFKRKAQKCDEKIKDLKLYIEHQKSLEIVFELSSVKRQLINEFGEKHGKKLFYCLEPTIEQTLSLKSENEELIYNEKQALENCKTQLNMTEMSLLPSNQTNDTILLNGEIEIDKAEL